MRVAGRQLTISDGIGLERSSPDYAPNQEAFDKPSNAEILILLIPTRILPRPLGSPLLRV